VLGLSTAYHLVRAGVRVTLIDRGDRGQATAAGAGILSGEATLHAAGPLYDLLVKSFRYYPSLMEWLAADDAGETGYAQCPMLIVAVDDLDAAPFAEARSLLLKERAQAAPATAEELCEVSPDEARRLFPPLTAIRHAIMYRKAGRVDGRLLAQALRRAGERHGLTVRTGSVSRLLIDRGRGTGVVVDNETLPASAVVLAAGAWSAAFGGQLRIAISVAPQRGQIVHLRMPDRETKHWPIVSGFRGHYIVSWPGGRVVAGATRETNSGFEPVCTAGGVREVLTEALRVAPGLAGAELQDVRVGLRPLAVDHAPVLGGVPGLERVYLATGHGPSGLQMGPFSGRLVADLVMGRPSAVDLAPFAVSRFPSVTSPAQGAWT